MSRNFLGDSFGPGVRPEVALVLDMLARELEHEIQLNAATGYQIHPKWPPPEVFERPGWDVCVLPPGHKEVEVREDVQHPPGDVVEPVVTKAVSFPVGGAPNEWGFGFHVPSRTYFLFQPAR